MRKYDTSSRLEELFRQRSGPPDYFPSAERVRVVEVPDFPTLGKLTALRFLEWVQLNPGGVISLPTGKTPEHFIRWTAYYLRHWDKQATRRELESWGLNPKQKPRLDSCHFVQIDEFYPIDPDQENSFSWYIKHFYLREFGLDPGKVCLMDTWFHGAPAGRTLGDIFPDDRVDLSLRYRRPADESEALQARAITAADQFATEYESRIRDLGGIGFFLGGIGPDGHIGFNIRGSDFYSTTRLAYINYETAAAAAGDLGGIEVSRRKLVVTVGLKTITWNPTVTAVIIAAGESKARVVKDAVENPPGIVYPASALQAVDGSRFYLTRGAASQLTERNRHRLKALKRIPPVYWERFLTDLAFRKKALKDLKSGDISRPAREEGLAGADRTDFKTEIDRTCINIRRKITRGSRQLQNMVFLHTAPHHDDIMLGYLPYIIHLVREPGNRHHFATLTSGFTSVTNGYTLSQLENLAEWMDEEPFRALKEDGYFHPENQVGRNRDIYQYLDGLAAENPRMQAEAEARRMLRCLLELSAEKSPDIGKKINYLKHYLQTAYPGKKDIPLVQKLKGMIREWEEELLWGHLGFNCEHIFHLRLGFYTGDIFARQPRWERDVLPFLELMEEVKPDVVTVALDPEGSGPDTHYKVLQIVAAAVKAYRKKHPGRSLKIWGYRNVWYRFHPSEANIFVPVSMNSLAIIKEAFHSCFGSQRTASFPSHEYDGPFCDLARKIMVEQYAVVKTCLGRDFFYRNPEPRLRATRSLNFLKEMNGREFLAEVRKLESRME